MFTVDPIGYFHSLSLERYQVPRQPSLQIKNEGIIELKSKQNFEQALEGLNGFERLWVIFHFHQITQWKTKVMPPRGGKKQGVFATRSPHRPNPIGISCVQLLKIQGLKLFIVNHDLIDGTPIIDIKPYLSYADAFNHCRQGWVDELNLEIEWMIEWSDLATQQINDLTDWGLSTLQQGILTRLKISPLPYPNNRVRKYTDELYELAYQTWRVIYSIEEVRIHVKRIQSGYDLATLKGEKTSQWDDVPLHQLFSHHYPVNKNHL